MQNARQQNFQISAAAAQEAAPARRVYRVSELNRLIRVALENEFGRLWIEGEISNLRKPSSGHCYFTLKDEGSQICAVLFRGNRAGVKVELRDGLKVRALGEISVYEAGGQYQIIVRQIEDAGKGSLQEAFEALKKKLQAEGLFDAARKKPLPMLPQHVAVVTSPTGAAIRDILNILDRRYPNLHVVIAPVRVQGQGAAEEIAAAIDMVNGMGGFDVMIVGRGGGSLEDLWCFNEEVVARAIARSRIPVISAVGHEIDFTISDFVADLRAPTPSAAAELMVGRKQSFEETLAQQSQRLVRALRQHALELRNRFVRASGSYVFREPRNMVLQYEQRIDGLRMRMAHEAQDALKEGRTRVEQCNVRMLHLADIRTRTLAQDIRRLESHLKALSPNAVLERGFSITSLPDGRILRSAREVDDGDVVRTRLSDGTFESKVEQREKGKADA